MQELKAILVRIQNGERNFRPQNSDLAELSAFQEIAKLIIYANEKGYIQEVKCLKDCTHPGSQIKNIIINGGLTFDGEQFLKEIEIQESDKLQKEDIIEIKPNFAGIGVNLNALFRYLRHKFAKRS